jgi:hypothetical protein
MGWKGLDYPLAYAGIKFQAALCETAQALGGSIEAGSHFGEGRIAAQGKAAVNL